MEPDLHDHGENGDYNGVGFVGISKIFATQEAFIYGTISFNIVYSQMRIMMIQ